MRFICCGADLALATDTVSKAISANRIPILEGINIKADGGAVVLSAYNEKMYIRKTIDANVEENGERMVNGLIFSEYAKKIADCESVEIEDGARNKIRIDIGSGVSEINYCEVNEFTDLGDYSKDISATLRQSELKTAIDSVIFCVGKKETRQKLNYVKFSVKEGMLELAAMDGFRVAAARAETIKCDERFDCLVFGPVLSDISKILRDTDEKVILYRDKNAVVIDMIHTQIRTVILAEEYIKYEAMFEKSQKSEITASKAEFERCLDRAGVISSEGMYHKVSISVEGDKIEICAENEKGRIDESMACDLSGENFSFKINNRYLQEGLSKVKGDSFRLRFVEEAMPMFILSNLEGKRFRNIILPLKNI